MTEKIVNNNKLQLILTEHGLKRISEALTDKSVSLNLTKIKFGSGDNYKYYEPTQEQTELKGPLDLEFFVYEKELLEDGLTISFFTVITEEIGGFEIREAGLYEVLDGEDKLFAICTQQPFIKPDAADNYFINLDYYIFLKDANFAEVYDQITLDVEHALVTERSLEDLMKSFLFAQGNLTNQIGNNSRLIGYGRATQLYKKIRENETNFSYITLYKNYASLLDMVSPDNIFSYWAFNFSRRKSVLNSIIDISKNGFNLTTNKDINTFTQDYEGFMSLLSFENSSEKGTDFYMLPAEIPMDLVSNGKDIPFTMIFALSPINSNTDRTLLAKMNKAMGIGSIQVQEKADGSLEVLLCGKDITKNYLKFSTGVGVIPQVGHSIVLCYQPATNGKEATMMAYIDSEKHNLAVERNNYTCMNETRSSLYKFSCTPTFSTYVRRTGEDSYIICNNLGDSSTDSSWKVQRELFEESLKGSGTTGYEITPKTETTPARIRYYTGANKYYELERAINFDESYSLLCYEVDPEKQIWTNRSINPTLLFNADGTPYTGNNWVIEDGQIMYISASNGPKTVATPNTKTNVLLNLFSWRSPATESDKKEVFTFNIEDFSSLYNLEVNVYYLDTLASATSAVSNIRLYEWGLTESSAPLIYTTEQDGFTQLYDKYYNYVEQNREDGFSISSSDGKIRYHYTDEDGTKQDKELVLIKDSEGTPVIKEYIISNYEVKESEQSILANSSSNPTLLFNESGSEYTGSDWTIEKNDTSGNKIYYRGKLSTFGGIQEDSYSPDVTSYIIDNIGNKVNFINSKVGVVSVVKEKLSDENARVLALTLSATMGKNPYMGGY